MFLAARPEPAERVEPAERIEPTEPTEPVHAPGMQNQIIHELSMELNQRGHLL
jgi:hypothetical protein